MIGDGEGEEDAKRKAQTLRHRDDVIFTGVVPDPERYYCAADAFILPSFYEGLPVVALEAQASGLPCFISDNVTRQCAVTGVTFVSLSKNANDWAKTIANYACGDRTQACAELMMSRFNIERSAKELRDYYFEIVKDTGATR